MKLPAKWAHLNEFKADENGEFRYAGSYRSLPAGEYPRFRAYALIFSSLCVVFAVVSGLITAGGMKNTFYVILPYIGEAASTFVLLWKSVRAVFAGERIKEYVYNTAVRRIAPAAVCCAVFALLGLVCSAVFLLLNGFGEKLFASVLLLALKLLACASALLLYRGMKGFEWT